MAQNDETKPKKKKKKIGIIIAVLAGILVLVSGVVIGVTVFANPSEDSFISRLTTKSEVEASDISIPLEEFLINVKGETANSQALVKMQITVTSLNDEATEVITEDIAKVRDAVIHVITSQSVDSILEEEDGEFLIKDKIKDRINESLTENLIEDVFVTDILIQR